MVNRARYVRDFLESHGFKAEHLRGEDEIGGDDATEGKAEESPAAALAPLFRLIGRAAEGGGSPAAPALTPAQAGDWLFRDDPEGTEAVDVPS